MKTLIGAFLLAGSLLHAQSEAPIDPEKASLIRQILEAERLDQRRAQLENLVVNSQVGLLRQNPIYPPAYVDELDKRIRAQLKDMDLVQLLTPTYAKNFSADELKQILAFETSPVGQKLAASRTEMLSEIIPAARAWALERGRNITREIFAEHPEFEKEIEANRAKSPDSNVNRIGGDVSAPVLISKVEPEYTKDAARGHLEGNVLLSIVVDEKGVPQDIHVIRPLGGGLDEKAIEAVTLWRFRPGMKNGAAVKTRAQVNVTFRLLDHPAQY